MNKPIISLLTILCIVLLAMPSCKKDGSQSEELNQLSYAGVTFGLKQGRSIKTELIDNGSGSVRILIDENEDDYICIWRNTDSTYNAKKLLVDYINNYGDDFTVVADPVVPGKYGRYDCYMANYYVEYNGTRMYGVGYVFDHKDRGGVFILKSSYKSKEHLTDTFGEIEASMIESDKVTNSISYGGISFDFPNDNWIIAANEDEEVYTIDAESPDEDVFTVFFYNYESDPREALKENLKGIKEVWEENITTKPIRKKKFGKYDALSADYLVQDEDTDMYGELYAFNTNGKSISIMRDHYEQRTKTKDPYRIIENSFTVK